MAPVITDTGWTDKFGLKDANLRVSKKHVTSKSIGNSTLKGEF